MQNIKVIQIIPANPGTTVVVIIDRSDPESIYATSVLCLALVEFEEMGEQIQEIIPITSDGLIDGLEAEISDALKYSCRIFPSAKEAHQEMIQAIAHAEKKRSAVKPIPG